MVSNLLGQFKEEIIKTAYLPAAYLPSIKADILKLKETENLNQFQKWIIDEAYILDLPKLAFTPKTIIVAAVKFQLVSVIFNYNGKRVRDLSCVKRSGIKEEISNLFVQNGFNIEYIHWLPQKRLAVCSGLATYGRNNLTYIEGWGSFYELQTYLSDIPAGQDYVFRDVHRMSSCDRCRACVKNCPTGAIKKDRFLIDNERCLTRLNESDAAFPDWVPSSAHHSVFGCYKCQNVCPKNKGFLANITEEVCFTQEETGMLLAGSKKEEMPELLFAKIERLGIDGGVLKTLPKNLKAILDNQV